MKLVMTTAFLSLVAASSLSAQTVTMFDTVFFSDEHGPRVATMYVPDALQSNGVGVALGHWWTGERQTMRVWAESLAANGYVAMTFDYYDFRHKDSICKYPKPVTTFKLAVEFLRSGAQRFGMTTGRVVGLGQSEGAIHWGQAIVWDNDDVFFGTDPTVDDRLDAVVLLYGAYDYERFLYASRHALNTNLDPYFSLNPALKYTKGSPIANVANVTVPVLLFHGTGDEYIRYEQSTIFYDSLLAHGKTSELHILQGRPHAFDLDWEASKGFTLEGLDAKDTVLAFLSRYVLAPSVSVDDPDFPGSDLPAGYTLSHNYPNPFNPSTTIDYTLPRGGSVALRVYNVLGEEVATLVEGELAAGIFRATWDASDLPSGVYFYRLTAGEHIQTRKMVLMK